MSDYSKYKPWEKEFQSIHPHSEMAMPYVAYYMGYDFYEFDKERNLIILKRRPYIIKFLRNLMKE